MADGVSFKDERGILRDAVTSIEGEIIIGEVAIGYGVLGEVMLDFLIAGFAVFIVVKFMSRLKNRAYDTKDKAVSTPKDIEWPTNLNKLMEEQNRFLKAKKQIG